VLFRELETDRLLLKNISSTDRDFIFALFSNDTVNKYLFDSEPITDIGGADKIIDFYLLPEPRGHHRWILVRKDDGTRLGTCGFHRWDNCEACCDVGYDLSPGFWGKGYMSEAMQAALGFAKKEMDIKKINACIHIENERSIKLAEKLGFTFDGQMKDEIFLGKEYPHKIFTYKC
jgi:ribosomal-protein-alanine N-acetyltransferase